MIADPTRGPRAEIVLSLVGGAGVASGVHRTLAVLAAAPAVEGVVTAPGRADRPRGTAVEGRALHRCAARRERHPGPRVAEPLDPVQFLEVVPLTGTEAAWVRLKGSRSAARGVDGGGHRTSVPRPRSWGPPAL
ncbi:hypothetical protein GS909_02525 [Rhodococcus hoagii]|nr:hypothetical protein [Prescottella equi]